MIRVYEKSSPDFQRRLDRIKASAPMFILMQLVGAAVAYGLIRLLYPADRVLAQR